MEKEGSEAVMEVELSTGSCDRATTTNQNGPTDDFAPPRVHVETVSHLIYAPVVGTILGFRDDNPIVDFPTNSYGRPVVARSTVSLRGPDIGREAILVFENGDPQQPIVLGLIQRPGGATPPAGAAAERKGRMEIEVDGEKVILSAEKEIVLRCGQASITLTRAGKVLIRGEYVLSRSSGVNRIKGAAVHIN
jgi:hypothetical protein